MAFAPPSRSPANAFSGTIERTRIPLHYQIGLACVAFAMVLLPLVYVALVYFMAKLVWWHLTNDTGIFTHTHGRAIIWALLFYLGPAIAGIIFVVFLIKPLFSRKPKPPQPFRVLEANEPELFAFVRKICSLVGAPEPREVRLDCTVNASAGFRRGWLSFFGNDLVLTLGMPLVAGMTMRQVAGVIAHEFGHFAQGAGMRLSYIIRSVNAWFARVVYERDSLDKWLETWAVNEDWRLQLIFKLAQGGVWVGRKTLWCLMMLGHAISCFMSRQMEFDADSYEAKIAGSDEFAKTAGRLRVLNASLAAATHDAQSTWQHHELPDNLPALVVWRESVMPEDIRCKIDTMGNEAKTHWAQTHPSDRDRINAAAALAAAGVFHLDDPASGLFSDFTTLCRAVTRHCFEHEHGLAIGKASFRTIEETISDRKSADDAEKSVERFFGSSFDISRIKPLPETTAAAWKPSLALMKASQAEYADLSRQHCEIASTIFKQSVGSDLVNAKFSIPAVEFGLKSNAPHEIKADIVQSSDSKRALESSMERHEAAALQRLAAALTWVAEKDGHPARLAELIQVQRVLATAQPEFLTVRQACSSLRLILNNAASHNDGIELQRNVSSLAQRVQIAFNHALNALGNLPHPWLPQGSSIRASLHDADPDDNDIVRALKAAEVCDGALAPLLLRVVGELCTMAIAAEETLALLPDLPAAAAAEVRSPAPSPQNVSLSLPEGIPPPTLR